MNKKKAIEILEYQNSLIPMLKNERKNTRKSESFDKWHRDTKVAISKIFGSSSEHKTEFENIRYSVGVYFTGMSDSVFDNSFYSGLDEASSMLKSMIDEIELYGLENSSSSSENEPLEIVERLCHRFHTFSRQLQSRYGNRQSIDISDEYDVQDIFHALLKIHFDDIRPEEYTPSYAGASTRVDFLLKKEKIIIELKKTRQNLKTKEVGEQLLIDIARYQSHPDCETLICFVYDPEGKIANPAGVEGDLEKASNIIKVKVIIAPK